jgi:DUF1365 family protein
VTRARAAIASCAYEGWVRHRRFEPVTHELRMRLFMLYLDLGELPALFDGWRIASARGRALAEFRRSDHLGDPGVPLDDAVRELVAARTGAAPQGPVRMLANLRYLGHGFNPVCFHYCFDHDGGEVQAVVAEVTNTPWRERHPYVLLPDPPRTPGSIMRGRFEKTFHVSPFMGMDHCYAWRLTEPGERLIAQIDSLRDGRRAFDATLSLRRRELTPAALGGMLARYPLLTLQSLVRIYLNGLTVWAKGAPYHRNPSGASVLRRGRGRRASEGDAGVGRD